MKMKILFATKEALKFTLCDYRANFGVLLSLTLDSSYLCAQQHLLLESGRCREV
jgi:hypothetical protein